MGTRNLIGGIVNGEWKARYNQYDGHPEGLGVNVLEFLRTVDVNVFRENFQKVQLVTEEVPPTRAEIQKYKEYSDISVGNQTYKEWYCLLRNTQGIDTFEEIYKGKLQHLPDDAVFLGDSLFCEWAWIFDFDYSILRVYKGFQKSPTPLSTLLPAGVDHNKCDKQGYYPCKEVATYHIRELPTIEEFLAHFSED